MQTSFRMVDSFQGDNVHSFDSQAWVYFVETVAKLQAPHNVKWWYKYKVISEPDPFPNVAEENMDIEDLAETTSEKMTFTNIIRISRIFLANEADPNQRKRITQALHKMADRADAFYQGSWWGTANKIHSWVGNLFASSSVDFHNNMRIELPASANDQLPYFVGTDATFARLVADCYS